MSTSSTPVNGTVVCFGASFDPPHFAHASLALLASRAIPGARIWLMPGLPRWDKAPVAPWETRLAWCEALARDLLRHGVAAEASRAERDVFPEGEGFRGTTVLFERLRRSSPGTRYVFLCGEDSLRSLPYWRDAAAGVINGLDLLCHHTMLVAPRPPGPGTPDAGRDRDMPWARHPAVVRLPALSTVEGLFARLPSGALATLSSSTVRESFRTGRDPGRFAPDECESLVRRDRPYLPAD